MEKEYTIRQLGIFDIPYVKKMDKESGFDVAEWCDWVGAWGVFEERALVAYATIAKVGGCEAKAIDHPLWNDNVRYFGNLYVGEEYRGRELGRILIGHLQKTYDENIFLHTLEPKLIKYYEKLGFSHIKDDEMIYIHFN